MAAKFQLLKDTLSDYYRRNPTSLRIFSEIVSNRSTVVSLRVLDWLVTNYVTAQSIPGETDVQRTERLNLFFNYTRNLDSYTKVWFDPFARKAPEKGSFKVWFHTETCMIEINDAPAPEGFISTTLGQLNFFRVAIEEGIISFTFENHEALQTHMLEGLSQRKKSKANGRKDVYAPVDTDEATECATSTTTYRPTPLDPRTAFGNDPTVRVSIQRKKVSTTTSS
jgi:hypothetical protein